MIHPARARTALSSSLALALSCLALGTSLHAQAPSLDKTGGGLPGLTTFSIAQGPAGQEYLLLLALSEVSTPLPNLGITLDVPVDFVGSSYVIPGFYGLLDGTGAANATLAFPDQAIFESLTLSMQAIVGSGPFAATNLIRLTPQLVGTFRPSIESPVVTIAGGGVASAPDGELLFVGGSGPIAQRYSSRTEQWENAGASFGVGLLSQATGLPDGRVLLTGGLDLTTGQPTAAAAVYDPATQQTTTLSMAIPRAGHGASVMGNGRVLITGGFEVFSLTDPLAAFAGIRASSEIFDPVTNTFAPGPNMLEARALHSSSTLSNGRVLIAGGLTLLPIVAIPTVSSTAYLFNPATSSFGLPSFFSGGRFLHSAVGLSDGKVLLVGGLSLDLTAFLTSGQITDIIVGTRNDCQLFTTSPLGFGTFATVGGMQEGRAGAAVAALPGGGALIAGGFRVTLDIPTSTFDLAATASADKFRQGPNSIAPTGSMAEARLFPVAVNLPDGTVMVVGGGPASAEIYQNN